MDHVASDIRRRHCALIDRLRSEPRRFELLQAVCIAELNVPQAIPLGQGFDPRREAVRLRGTLTQAFPTADLESWQDGMDGERPSLTSAFLSLGGAFGPLPPPYSELGLDQQRRGDSGIRDFLDIFNHRLMSLFVRAKRAHRPAQQRGRPEQTEFANLLWTILGLGTPGLRYAHRAKQDARLPELDRALPACAGILNLRPASAHAIEQITTYIFAVHAKVVPFAGRWLVLDGDQTTALGPLGRNQKLGMAVVGRRVWDQSAAIRLKLGPMAFRQMLEFLPGSKCHTQLQELLRFVLDGLIEIDIEITLPAGQVPQSRLLTAQPSRTPRLGWTSWLTTRPRTAPGAIQLHLRTG